MLTDGEWLRAAAHANAMAARLSTGMTDLGLPLASATDANEVFVGWTRTPCVRFASTSSSMSPTRTSRRCGSCARGPPPTRTSTPPSACSGVLRLTVRVDE